MNLERQKWTVKALTRRYSETIAMKQEYDKRPFEQAPDWKEEHWQLS